MTARLIVADVHDGLATLEPGSCDLILSSPPFLAVRSYLPADHPDKAKEIGSEATPADYLDTLLDVVEACARVLAPHGSLAFELGDTHSGNGEAGWERDKGVYRREARSAASAAGAMNGTRGRSGWPLDKSLCGIPTLFAWSLAYGRNLLRPERQTPPWRIRTLKAWIRTNPPVGALGDKERPATSYIVVATKAKDRWFDLDAVRTPSSVPNGGPLRSRAAASGVDGGDLGHEWDVGERLALNAAGAPPLDWWTHIDAVLDNELARTRHQTGEAVSFERGNEKHVGDTNRNRPAIKQPYAGTRPGATGAHLRRALQAAGILHLKEAIDQSPGGYSGAHYAVWPPELVSQLIQEMAPRQVCRTCGQPRRRIVTLEPGMGGYHQGKNGGSGTATGTRQVSERNASTVGWSDCGHDNYRPGLVLDPFAGSGTTLAVAHGHGRDTIGIDIDSRNAELARGRLGMFLEVDEPEAAS